MSSRWIVGMPGAALLGLAPVAPAGAEPDFAVEKVWSEPAAPVEGSSAKFCATVKNAGPDAAPEGTAVVVSFALGKACAAQGKVPAAPAPGKTVTVRSDPVKIPAAAVGRRTLKAMVDEEKAVADASRDNNALEAAVTVRSKIDPAAPIPGASYQPSGAGKPQGTVEGPRNPDVNIKLRGAKAMAGPHTLVEYPFPAGEPPDPKAPKLYSLFSPARMPAIGALYKVGVFEGLEKGVENRHPNPQLVSFETKPGEAICAPASGYPSWVVYADEDSLAISWGGDTTIEGYSMHLLGVCPEPSLRGLYEKLAAAGRRQIPGVKAGTPLGRAKGQEIWVSIRDSGDFLDPRSRLDWWKDAPGKDLAPTTITDPEMPPSAKLPAAAGAKGR